MAAVDGDAQLSHTQGRSQATSPTCVSSSTPQKLRSNKRTVLDISYLWFHKEGRFLSPATAAPLVLLCFFSPRLIGNVLSNGTM